MCSNGNHVWIELSGMPLMNDDKQFSGYQGIGRDITKSKIIEEDNKRLLAIIEHIPEIIQMSDFHGNLLYLNKAGKNLLKIPNGFDITTYTEAQLLSPQDWKKITKARDVAIKEGMWQGLTKLRATDGTYISVSQMIIAHKTSKNDELFFFTIARDISDTIKLEEKLETANRCNRYLIELHPQPLFIVGSDGKIQDVNQATEIMVGYSRKKLVGTDFSSYFSNPERVKAWYDVIFSQGHVRDYPLEMIHKKGTRITTLYSATIYKNNKGKIQGFFITAKDVTGQQTN